MVLTNDITHTQDQEGRSRKARQKIETTTTGKSRKTALREPETTVRMLAKTAESSTRSWGPTAGGLDLAKTAEAFTRSWGPTAGGLDLAKTAEDSPRSWGPTAGGLGLAKAVEASPHSWGPTAGGLDLAKTAEASPRSWGPTAGGLDLAKTAEDSLRSWGPTAGGLDLAKTAEASTHSWGPTAASVDLAGTTKSSTSSWHSVEMERRIIGEAAVGWKQSGDAAVDNLLEEDLVAAADEAVPYVLSLEMMELGCPAELSCVDKSEFLPQLYFSFNDNWQNSRQLNTENYAFCSTHVHMISKLKSLQCSLSISIGNLHLQIILTKSTTNSFLNNKILFLLFVMFRQLWS